MRVTEWFLEKISTWEGKPSSLRLDFYRKAQVLLQDPSSRPLASVPLLTCCHKEQSCYHCSVLSSSLTIGPEMAGPLLSLSELILLVLSLGCTHLLETTGSQQYISFEHCSLITGGHRMGIVDSFTLKASGGPTGLFLCQVLSGTTDSLSLACLHHRP